MHRKQVWILTCFFKKSSTLPARKFISKRTTTHTRDDYHVTGQGCPRWPRSLSGSVAPPSPPASSADGAPPSAPAPSCGPRDPQGRSPTCWHEPWHSPGRGVFSGLTDGGEECCGSVAEDPGRHGAWSNRPVKRRSWAHLGWRTVKHGASGMARHSCSSHTLPATQPRTFVVYSWVYYVHIYILQRVPH